MPVPPKANIYPTAAEIHGLLLNGVAWIMHHCQKQILSIVVVLAVAIIVVVAPQSFLSLAPGLEDSALTQRRLYDRRSAKRR